MDIQVLSHKLQERIKELSCLYSISKIAQDYQLPLHEVIEKMLIVIPTGWEFPDEAKVWLDLDGEQFGELIEGENYIESKIVIQEIQRGIIKIQYQKKRAFLKEELLLLDKISAEIALVTDRHEQLKLKQLFEQKMRYNDRLNVLGELTAGIAHELNTPLGTILGYAELLYKTEESKERKSDLKRIISSSITAREILKKLMYFSCEMPSQFEVQSLNAVVRDSVDLLQLPLKEKSVKLCLNLDDSLPHLKIDTIQFTQVIFNLVLNSLNAMPNGGVIEISTHLLDNLIEMEVRDTGKGIRPETIPKIFQPFFTNKPGGTGLGLSVVHGIVQSHKGTIVVNSELNVGTSIRIQIPIMT